MQISISEFINLLCYYVIWYQLVHSSTCKEFVKTGYFPILQSNHYTSCESPRNIQSQRRHLQITSQTRIGLAIQPVFTKVMARAMSMFLAWVVVKPRQISRETKKS